MSLLKDIATLGQLPALLRLKKGMTPRPEDVKDCFGARVEANAANLGTQSAIVCEGKNLTGSSSTGCPISTPTYSRPKAWAAATPSAS